MKKKKIIIAIVAVITILCILGGGFAAMWIFNREGLQRVFSPIYGGIAAKNGKLIDDWQYAHAGDTEDGMANVVYESSSFKGNTGAMNDAMVSSDSTLGFSVGGAKNVDNFDGIFRQKSKISSKKSAHTKGISPLFRFQAEYPLDVRHEERGRPLDFHAD